MIVPLPRLSPQQSQRARTHIGDLLHNTIQLGPVTLRVPDPWVVTKTIEGDKVVLTWDQPPEINIPGPIDPDIIRVTLTMDWSEVETHLGTWHIDHPAP